VKDVSAIRQHGETLYTYRGQRYPVYLKHWNMTQFIEPIAKQFCQGFGLDVGAGKWPLKGSRPIDITRGESAEALPEGEWDYVYSSHCLEHVNDPVSVLEHWKSRIRPGGVLFLYLPSPDMRYWRPSNCRRHRHIFHPADVAEMLTDLGFLDVIHSERDMAWSFACIGWNGAAR